jgi:predicted NBD/HSP70 family sugar kinase
LTVTSVGQVIELARRGDETARRAVARQTEVLGNLLTTITAFFDPELIVVGGGIAQHLDMLAVGLAGRLDGDRTRPRFVASALGADAIVQGAVVRGVEIAREAVFAERMSVDPGA